VHVAFLLFNSINYQGSIIPQVKTKVESFSINKNNKAGMA